MRRDVVLLTPAQTGLKVGRSELTLGRWRRERRGPPYIRLGKGKRSRVAYVEYVVDDWLLEQQVELGLDPEASQ